MEPPKLHDRSLSQLVGDGEALAQIYTPEWTGVSDTNDAGHGLIELAGRLVELLAERVNRAPEKNFLAFLDLVGVERSPGRPAEAPITFVLSKDSEGQQVPGRTQVATTQSEVADAQVFEARNPFFATPARVAQVVAVWPSNDWYDRLAPLNVPPTSDDLADASRTIEILSPDATGASAVEHVLYLASARLFGQAQPTDISLDFTVADGSFSVFDPQFLAWQRYDDQAQTWVDVANVTYAAAGTDVSVAFPGFPGTAASSVDDEAGMWIAARLKAVPTSQLPTIGSIVGKVTTASAPTVAADAVLADDVVLDTSKPIYPFGARPRYGDVFQIGCAKAFGPDVASATVRLTLRPYTLTELQAIFATINAAMTITTVIEWQYLATGGRWKTINTFTHNVGVTNGTPPTFAQTGDRDPTLFGTIGGGATVDFIFTPSADAGEAAVGGVTSRWIRAIVRSQSPYGRDGSVTFDAANKPVAVGPTFVPPIIESIQIDYQYKTAPVALDSVTALNNFTFEHYSPPFFPPGQALQPFVPMSEYVPRGSVAVLGTEPALHLGFDRPFGAAFISLLIALLEPSGTALSMPETGSPRITWEYLTAVFAWKPLDISDGTADMTTGGVIGLTAPDDSSAQVLFPTLTQGMPLFWYRARLVSGAYANPPRLQAVLLNTVMADNQQTVPDDWILTSGTGEPSQQAIILRQPVLAGDIWVLENEVPTAAEADALLQALTERAIEAGTARLPILSDIIVQLDLPSGDREIWVQWLRVANFRVSGPRDRHYTLEAAIGAVTFGDGQSGLTLPIGKDNVVVRGLTSGGGETANRVAVPLAIKELKTSVAAIDKVFNLKAAVGGADAWTLDQTYELGPQAIKNLGRSITTEDYEWITLANFSQVARAKCLATQAPAAGGGLTFRPGAVSLIIVPKGTERTPQPPRGLLRRIEQFLQGRVLGAIVADIHAIPPAYQPVAIAAQVHAAVAGNASAVARRVVQALEAFFHPLSGGEQQDGWPFGRTVYISEVYAVIERTDGVDHVVSASFVDDPGVTALTTNPNVLVASGSHQIAMV